MLGDDCVEVERYSAPSWVLWSVIASGDGWFGWTPNSDEERSAADAGGSPPDPGAPLDR